MMGGGGGGGWLQWGFYVLITISSLLTKLGRDWM